MLKYLVGVKELQNLQKKSVIFACYHIPIIYL